MARSTARLIALGGRIRSRRTGGQAELAIAAGDMRADLAVGSRRADAPETFAVRRRIEAKRIRGERDELDMFQSYAPEGRVQ